MAIAMAAPGPDGQSLNSAAWLKGEPDAMQRGLGTTTRSELRALFGLPATDSATEHQPTPTIPWLGILGAAALSAWLAIRRGSRDVARR